MMNLFQSPTTNFERITDLVNQDDTMQNMHVYLYSKDLNGQFLSSNACLSQDAGFVKETEMLALTDFDVCWKNFASTLRKTDEEVIATRKPKFQIETIEVINGDILELLTCKFPLHLNSRNILGVGGLSFSLCNQELLTKLNSLCEPEPVYNDKVFEAGVHISKRQLDCLFQLVKGMTIKEIGKELELSPRTVEHHLNIIKVKLNCSSRSMLISKALTLRIIQEKLQNF